MSDHTPEPWKVYDSAECYVGKPLKSEPASWDVLCGCNHGSGIDGEGIDASANAQRIVACVNGCEGINPEAVQDLLQAAKYAKRCVALLEVDEPEPFEILEAQRRAPVAYQMLEDAIAKAEGKEEA